jgi:hypothetical protein
VESDLWRRRTGFENCQEFLSGGHVRGHPKATSLEQPSPVTLVKVDIQSLGITPPS